MSLLLLLLLRVRNIFLNQKKVLPCFSLAPSPPPLMRKRRFHTVRILSYLFYLANRGFYGVRGAGNIDIFQTRPPLIVHISFTDIIRFLFFFF